MGRAVGLRLSCMRQRGWFCMRLLAAQVPSPKAHATRPDPPSHTHTHRRSGRCSFVLTLKKGRYTYQFGQYAWTHMILMVWPGGRWGGGWGE